MKSHHADNGSPPSPKKRGRSPLPWPGALALFLLLLVLPIGAAIDLSKQVDWRFLASYATLISILTFTYYWSDKRKAKADQWRIPESTLHLLEGLGGWPTALLAQRFLRHKTKKRKYQTALWLIIATHQTLSFEVLSQGLLFRSLLQQLAGG